MGIPFNELNRVLDLGFKPLPWGSVGYLPSKYQPLRPSESSSSSFSSSSSVNGSTQSHPDPSRTMDPETLALLEQCRQLWNGVSSPQSDSPSAHQSNNPPIHQSELDPTALAALTNTLRKIRDMLRSLNSDKPLDPPAAADSATPAAPAESNSQAQPSNPPAQNCATDIPKIAPDPIAERFPGRKQE
jgi:hypothetical protein